MSHVLYYYPEPYAMPRPLRFTPPALACNPPTQKLMKFNSALTILIKLNQILFIIKCFVTNWKDFLRSKRFAFIVCASDAHDSSNTRTIAFLGCGSSLFKFGTTFSFWRGVSTAICFCHRRRRRRRRRRRCCCCVCMYVCHQDVHDPHTHMAHT
jgi:hypothetical protein